MYLKPILLLALVAESTYARLKGHDRRHIQHGSIIKIHHSVQARGLIDVNSNVGDGPLTATVGLDAPAGTGIAGKPHGDGHPGEQHPHDGLPGGHPHGHSGHGQGHRHGQGHGQGHGHGHEHGGYGYGYHRHRHPHDDGNDNDHIRPPFPVRPATTWTNIPAPGKESTAGFGKRTQAHGDGVGYAGNVGDPWGSNIITVKETDAHKYKYVAQFHGSKNVKSQPWNITVWNKIGPDGKIDGFFGHSALDFTLHPNEIVYVAFDENSQGGWGAAPGDHLPTDQWGSYSATWGEFDFADEKNGGLSGFDVSCIQAQNAKQEVQGMKICLADSKKCSSITPNVGNAENAYTVNAEGVDGMAPTVGPGPIRLVVDIDYQG